MRAFDNLLSAKASEQFGTAIEALGKVHGQKALVTQLTAPKESKAP